MYSQVRSAQKVLLGSVAEGMQDVSTIEMFKAWFLGDLLELQSLQEQRACIAKEREIGQHCYMAEEILGPSDLLLLKRLLQVSEDRWHSYKAQLIAGRSPEE